MSNSIINTASSKTIGSPSSESSGALPRSGDVFANLFQILNSSARVQISEDSNAINVQDIGTNVIKTAIDFPKSNLTDPANEIAEQLNVSGSQTMDLIDLKAFKIPVQHTILANDSDSNLVSRTIIEIEEISTMILKLISEEAVSEETLSEIHLSKESNIQGADLPLENNAVLSTSVEEIGLEVEDFYGGFSSKDLPHDLSTYYHKGIKSFESASSDPELSNSIKDQKTVKIFLGDVESDEAVFVTVTANQDKNTFVKSREISSQFSEPVYTSHTISETDNELVLKIHRPNGPPGVVIVEINELLESADFDQKFKVDVVFEDPDPEEIAPAMRNLNKLSGTIGFEYAQTDTSKYEISEISSEINFDKNHILMVKEKLRNLLDASSKARSNKEIGEITKEAISNSIETTEKQELVSVVIRKVLGKSLGELRKKPTQASLMFSSADIVSIRADAIKPVYANQEVFKAFNVSRENIAAASSVEEVDKILNRSTPTAETTDLDTSRFIDRQMKFSNNVSQSEFNSQSSSVAFVNSYLSRNISILDAQFASRLAAIAVEQAMNASEAIELNLEPKSFGKLQINASLDNSGLDIKLTAENSATIAILRGTEGLLSSITEQHGLRLSQYNVDFAHGEGDGQSRKDHPENIPAGIEKQSLENEELMQTGDSIIDANRLLNLIA
jgi:hypothetical protein